jgi:hypothetical protein
VAGSIAANLESIESDQGLCSEAYSLLAEFRGKGGITRDNPDFDRSLRYLLQSQHANVQLNGDGKYFSASLRRALRFRSREQVMSLIAECAMGTNTSSMGHAYYNFAQLALGSRDPTLATRLCEEFAADFAKSGNRLPFWLSPIYQDYLLLRGGYNPLLREPFADGSNLPDPVRDVRHARPVDYLCTLLKDGIPDLKAFSNESLGAKGDFERRDIVAHLHNFLVDHLECRPPSEQLAILSDGRLFPLLLWEDYRSRILPKGKGHDPVLLKPWIDAINRCPDADAREQGLRGLAQKNRPIFEKSAGTCLIIDSMPSLENVESTITCAAPHRRITESVQKELIEQHHHLAALDAGPSGFGEGSAGRLFDLVRKAHSLIPKEVFIAMIERQIEMPDSGLCAKASYGLACLLLGSQDPRHRDALRAFLTLPENPNREIDDQKHAIRVHLYTRYFLLEHGINWLTAPVW